MLIPLRFPPGMLKNGTSYNRKGRWTDGNLVRWREGSVRPIGGWEQRRDSSLVVIPELIADPDLEAIRDSFAWRSLTQQQCIVFGSNLKLYFVSQTGVVTDITPVGVTTSGKDASVQAGYGNNPYGVGSYGVPNDLVAQDPIPPNRWAFTNFGEILLTCQRAVGDLYELDLGTLTLSTVVNAPTDIQDVVVTDERIVLTIGADMEPRKVQWSDQEDRTLWAPAIDNQAGSLTLTGGGKLLRAVNVMRQVLILGEDTAHTARYIGPPYVMAFDLVSSNCSLVAAEAVIATSNFAVWWGDRSFWLYDGSINPLNCEVIEFLNEDVDFGQISKVTGFSNNEFHEVWWLYQSTTSQTGECDSYVIWNYKENYWNTGRINRTTGLDKGATTVLMMVTREGGIFNHELEGVEVVGTAYIESGFLDMQNGERNVAVRYIYPDTAEVGDTQIEIIGRNMPTDAPVTYGPYTYANPTPVRAIGRELKFKFTGLTPQFEVGTMRAEVAPAGGGMR